MPTPLFRTFVRVLEVFRPAVTAPSFANLIVLATGYVLTYGPHTVTAALLATGVAGVVHHERFHRFFSRGTWDPDAFGRCLLQQLVARTGGTLRLAIDDTFTEHRGANIFGVGCHLDAVRSTKAFKVFGFGHCWVTLCVVMSVPWSHRPWALPVLFRLYRPAADTPKDAYRKKTQLAREMLDRVLTWFPALQLEVAADQAYCNHTLLGGLPQRVTWQGAMRPDAALTAVPPPNTQGRRGRPRKRGDRLPSPATLARDSKVPWTQITYDRGGTQATVAYKTCVAQWYAVTGACLLRIVVVRQDHGRIPWRVYFCTDVTRTVADLLTHGSWRWSIEVWYRDAKQWLGLGDSPAQTATAVLRTTPFLGLLSTALVLWFWDARLYDAADLLPTTTWYRQKQTYSFSDILRTARTVFAKIDILEEVYHSKKLSELRVDQDSVEKHHFKLAS
jgi:DDE superfamily endonuclease